MDSRYDEAEAVLRQGLQIAPRSEALFGTLVSLHPAMYEPEEVLKIADEWAAAIPTSVRPVVFRAIAQLEMTKRAKRSRAEAIGHLELALQAIDRAKQIDATDPGLSSVHAQALRLQADFESDPTERARLRAQADEIMQRSRSAQRPLPPDRSAFETGSAIASAPTNIPFGPSGAVRVGGNIRQPAKIKDVRPLYPPEAIEARIQGVVILEIVVGEDGKVADARVLRSIPLLDQAAVDAVRQWEFELTALNGRPVPVIMTVTVSFNMQ
jgi:TonB family protein